MKKWNNVEKDLEENKSRVRYGRTKVCIILDIFSSGKSSLIWWYLSRDLKEVKEWMGSLF